MRSPVAPPQPALDRAYLWAVLEEDVDRFESMSTGLVLLEPYPLAEVRRRIGELQREVRAHSAAAEARLDERARPDEPPGPSLVKLVRSDHRWFEMSFEQIDWFLQIAERDGHGGNRQALGQYGRLLAEAVRRHLEDERRLDAGEPGSAGKP